MSKEIKYSKEARLELAKGVNALADAVGATLGAKGRNAILQRDYGAPHVTKDGVTVAMEIELPHPIQNMGAQMIKEVAAKAAEEAGDGTTTATILAQYMINRGLEELNKRRGLLKNRQTNPMDLKRGMDKAVNLINTFLTSVSQKVTHDNEKIKQIATISANNDAFIGGLIAKAMSKVSIDGDIRVEESKNTDTYVDVVDGVQYITGLLSPYFVNNPEKMTTEFDNPLILMYGKKVGNTREILPAIELAIGEGRPLIIMADDFEGEVIHTLVQNRVKKQYQIAAVKSPFFGDKRKNSMEDLSILLGGTYISEEKGVSMKDFTMEMFGTAERVIMSQDKTTIMNGSGDKLLIQERIDSLRSQIEDSTQEWDDNELKSRISKLNGGVAVIYVGANTEVEMKEKKDRIDDALAATKAAVEEGIVAGGGVTLFKAIDELEYVVVDNKDQQIGVDIVKGALEVPISQIAKNSGIPPEEVLAEVISMGYPYGYDAKNDIYVDMFKAGIIDPKKVTRVALESAVSVASLILTTEVTVSNLIK